MSVARFLSSNQTASYPGTEGGCIITTGKCARDNNRSNKRFACVEHVWNMRVDVCVDLCVDMCADLCVDMCAGMRTGL